jgi:hypothetical protein
VFTVLCAPLARAEERGTLPFELGWSAPPGCPQAHDVAREVWALAGSESDASRRLRARGVVVQSAPEHWTLSLETELDGIAGERTLVGSSCRALSDAAALTLALLLNPDFERDPERVGESKPSAPARAGSAAPRAVRPEDEEAHVVPEGTGARRLRWLASAGAGLHVGILPDPGPAIAVATGLRLDRASLWVELGYATPEEATVTGYTNKGATLWLGSLGALGCWAAVAAQSRLDVCAGIDVARLQGRGVGVNRPREGVVYWASSTAGLRWILPVTGAVAGEVSGIGLLPFRRPDVFLDNIGEVHRPAPMGGRLHLGLVVTLW